MSENRERRKAVVRGVPLGGKEWDFWFCKAGVVVHKKHTSHFKSVVVPWQHVATGAGLEVEAGGRVFRVALRKDGLVLCEVKNHAHTKLLPWAKLAWEADLADESVVQPPLFRELCFASRSSTVEPVLYKRQVAGSSPAATTK